MKMNGLPKDPGPAGWDAILPPRAAGPKLEEKRSVDWLVVGAGFAGLAAARRLLQLHPKDTIAILEARNLAEGPVARNSGFMVDLPHVLSSSTYGSDTASDRAQIEQNRSAIAFVGEAVEEYEIPAEAFDPVGKVNGAMSEQALQTSRDYSKHLAALDEPHEILDAKDMQDLTGSSAYSGGLRTPGTVLLQSALYARGVGAGLIQKGVAIYENSPVVDFGRSGRNWLATTPRGAIEAPRVILAVNGQIERFGHFRNRLLHVYLYASLTRALSKEEQKILGGQPTWGITPADPMGTSVRRISGIGGTRVLIRNRITYDANLEGREAPLKRFAKTHDASFARRWPALAGMEMEHRWGGALCLSRNDTPAFGEVDDGLFAAACQNGLGTTHGTASGMLAAELASGLASPALDDQLSKPQPTRLPPMTKIGAPLVLMAKEWKARSEL